jgi:elongation factor 1-alpha
MPWYTGQTLIQALDAVELPAHQEKTLRFVVQDNYPDNGGKITVGRVESGILTQGDNVIFQPSGFKAKVEKIKLYEGELPRAETGDAVGIIVNVTPKRGDVLGTIDNPPVAVKEFLGEVVLLENKLGKGDVVELMCGTARASARVKEIKEKINSETGEVMEKNPAFISENDAATIIFTTEPLVVEKFADIPELGRFVLARDGRSIGAGIVLEKAL